MRHNLRIQQWTYSHAAVAVIYYWNTKWMHFTKKTQGKHYYCKAALLLFSTSLTPRPSLPLGTVQSCWAASAPATSLLTMGELVYCIASLPAMQEVGGGTFPTSIHTHGRHKLESGQYSSYEAEHLPLLLFHFQVTLLSRRPSRREHVFERIIPPAQ